MTSNSEWLRLSDIAAELGVSMNTIYKWSPRGQPHFPRCYRLPNGRVQVQRRDFDKWLEAKNR